MRRFYFPTNPLEESQWRELFSNLWLDDAKNAVVTVTTPAVADTEFAVAHGHEQMPRGYLVIGKDKPCDVYTSKAADDTNVYLKCTAVSATVTLLIV